MLCQYIARDPNPGFGALLTLDPGLKKIQIREKHPGSPSFFPACLFKRCRSGFTEYRSGFLLFCKPSGKQRDQPFVQNIKSHNVFFLSGSVPDPDPPDPHVFGPPGSRSTSQRYGSGSFYHHAKIVRKTLIPSIL
jgi:hypothetical protein